MLRCFMRSNNIDLFTLWLRKTTQHNSQSKTALAGHPNAVKVKEAMV